MTFRDAFESLSQGHAIKRAKWLGYWISPVDHSDVVVHNKDGSLTLLSKGCKPLFTLNQTIADDWVVLSPDEQYELDLIHESGVLSNEDSDTDQPNIQFQDSSQQ